MGNSSPRFPIEILSPSHKISSETIDGKDLPGKDLPVHVTDRETHYFNGEKMPNETVTPWTKTKKIPKFRKHPLVDEVFSLSE